MANTCAVALVDRDAMPSERWTALLSDRERIEASTYRHPVRRERTTTSRVLTKYLTMQSESFGFRRVGAAEIEAASSSDWSAMELLSGSATARTKGTIFRGGLAFPELSVSSSHCGRCTASCIGRTPVGLDLERIERRRQEFYARAFSAEERAWVERVRARGAVSKEAAFTLLWSVKEAYLKASGRRDISVWSFPRWTVWFADGIEAALQPVRPEAFVRLGGGISTRGFADTFEIAAMSIDDMTLATVQLRGTRCEGRTIGRL